MTFTILWIWLCAAYVLFNITHGLTATPQALSSLIVAMFLPPAIVWMSVSALQRQSDVNRYTRALRLELESLLFPSPGTAHRVNEDIERLCRQAADISKTTDTVLSSLKVARSSLRDEMRSFSSFSKKAGQHIDRLAATLQTRVEKLTVLTGEIEERTNAIDEKVMSGAEAWDQATLKITEQAASMEISIEQNTNKILEATDKTLTRSESVRENITQSCATLVETIGDVQSRLEGLDGRFNTHKDELSNVTDHIAHESERISDIIISGIRNIEDAANDSFSSVEVVIGKLDTQRETFRGDLQSFTDHSGSITTAIDANVKRLEGAVNFAIGKTGALEESIERQTIALRNIVQNISREADNIEEASTQAANRLGSAMSVAVEGAETVSMAVRHSVEQLEQATLISKSQAEDLIKATTGQIEELQTSSSKNAQIIIEVSAIIEDNRRKMEDLSGTTRTHMDEISEAIEQQKVHFTSSSISFVDAMRDVGSSFEQPLKDIQTAAMDADARHSHLSTILERRVAELNDASTKATDSAENIRTILQGQAHEIANASVKISAEAKAIAHSMESQKDNLSTQILESLADIRKASVELEEHSHHLKAVSDKAVEDISQLDGKLALHSADITLHTRDALENLNRIDETLTGKAASVKEYSAIATQSLTQLNDTLTANAGSAEPVYTRAIEQAEQAQKQFEILKSGFETSLDGNLAKLKDVGVVFDERLKSLMQDADMASDKITIYSTKLEDRLHDMNGALSQSGDKIRALSASLERQPDDIHLITDQSLLKIENTQKMLNDYFHEFAASVEQAIFQLQSAGGEFIGQSQLLKQETEKAVMGFEQAGDSAEEKSISFSRSAEETAEKARAIFGRVEQEADALIEKAKINLTELRKAGDSFVIRSSQMAEHMKSSLTTSEIYGEAFKKQALSISEISSHSADEIVKATSILQSKLTEVSHLTHSVHKDVSAAQDSLSTESERFLQVSTSALEAAREASITFGRQSESLFKASHDAARISEDVKKSEMNAQRGAFLNATKFIVESLYSLSIDMARMLDGDISEKTWKAFQKGDVSAFTRKLAEAGKFPLEKARDKFTKDTEFRTFVQRYIRQFEELYNQAIQNDHGSLLATTIGTSETARLYQSLCHIAGKEPKTAQEVARAA